MCDPLPSAERAKLVVERNLLVVLGAVGNVDKRHAFGLFVRAAPLGLGGSEAASDPGLRTARFTRRPPPWAGLGVSLRDGSQNGVGSPSSPAPHRCVLKTETRDRLLVRPTRNKN